MARLLVAEDDESVRAFVMRALDAAGHAVTAVGDGGTALESLMAAEKDGTPYDLLLADIKMPVMDGVALALTVSRDLPQVRVLLMTGYADQRERAYGLEALIHGVMSKPFTLDDLTKQVSAALAC